METATAGPSPLVREKRRAAAGSVLAGLFLTVIKLAAGLATSSLGLIAEAAHSALDTGAAILTWFAVRASWRPPDADHQYGHGKIESLTALAETLLLVITSLWIIREAVDRMLGGGPEVEPSVWAFVVIGISIVVDIHRSRDLGRVARKSRSQALEADALHFSTDIASSSVVILGLIGVVAAKKFSLPGLALADSIAAIVVAVIVLVLSWNLGKRAVDMLLDRAPAGAHTRIVEALAGSEGLEQPARVRVRQAGDRAFADVDLVLRRGLPIAEGERVAEAVRERVKAVLGEEASILVQLRPGGESGSTVRDRVATAVAMEGVHAHNITVRDGGDACHADLHLELPETMTLDEAHAVADRVERTVLREVTRVDRVDIHLELHHAEPESATPLQGETRARIAEKVHEVALEVAGEDAVHDILLIRTDAGLYLSCHYYLPGGASLRDAHEVTDRLEKALYRALPELHRVSVHAEPRERGTES